MFLAGRNEESSDLWPRDTIKSCTDEVSGSWARVLKSHQCGGGKDISGIPDVIRLSMKHPELEGWFCEEDEFPGEDGECFKCGDACA